MLDVAIEAARVGGALAFKYFNNLPKVSYKTDNSPVTKADIETEKLIRKIISKNFPDHGIIGEELPPTNPKSPYQWVIDPIDGTRDFIRKIPYWAVFIALLKKNQTTLGVIFLPATKEMIIAEKGKGTRLNGKRVYVSKTKKLKEAYISHGSIKRLSQTENLDSLAKVCKQVATDCSYRNLGFKFLLEGKIDIVIENFGKFYDFAAPSIIAQEAGATFSDFSGKKSLTSGNIVYANPLLHKQVIKILNS